jgi:hypothetical protein
LNDERRSKQGGNNKQLFHNSVTTGNGFLPTDSCLAKLVPRTNKFEKPAEMSNDAGR